jgi:hypothetical protein
MSTNTDFWMHKDRCIQMARDMVHPSFMHLYEGKHSEYTAVPIHAYADGHGGSW